MQKLNFEYIIADFGLGKLGKFNCEAVNDFSVGIELEGCDDDEFEEAQYRTLVELTHLLTTSIPSLSSKHIYGHEEVAPGRKTDPGPGFDWQAYRFAVSEKEFQIANNEYDVQ